MKDRKLATRYARALIATLPDDATADRVDQFLLSLGQTMERSRDIREALEDPSTSRAARLEALQSLATDLAMPPQVGKFLEAVVDHGRIPQLPAIGTVFHEMREQARGVLAATIQTPVPMTDDMRDRARASLEKMTGKKIRLDCEVDPDLIGGAVTRIGSTVYDGSLRTQLDSLRRRMVQE